MTTDQPQSAGSAPDDDFAVVNLGTGVGVGFVLGGRLVRGSTNSAGEWGHTTLVMDNLRCRRAEMRDE